MPNDTERRLDSAMMDVYHRAQNEAKYTEAGYLQMLHEHRGLETARILLHRATVSEGYTALWERGHLDLTVEALILQPEWRFYLSEILTVNAILDLGR